MSSYRTMLSGIAAFALLLSSVLIAMPVAAATADDKSATEQRADDHQSLHLADVGAPAGHIRAACPA